MEKQQRMSPAMALLRVLQGALIGLGAVLPGISGGVLCVIFGIYRPVMELLSDPRKNYKTHLPKLAPVFLGMAVGFLGGGQPAGLLFGSISQSVGLPVRGPDRRNAAFVAEAGG